MLKTFMANTIRLSIECSKLNSFNIDSLESEKIVVDNQILESIFDKSTLSFTIEPAILDQLEKQQNNRLYDFNQYQIFLKLQTALMARIKGHKQNLPSKLLPMNI